MAQRPQIHYSDLNSKLGPDVRGGPAGSHLLEFLHDVRVPAITSLHTLLIEPNQDQRAVMKQLDELSNRFIVMTERNRN